MNILEKENAIVASTGTYGYCASRKKTSRY